MGSMPDLFWPSVAGYLYKRKRDKDKDKGEEKPREYAPGERPAVASPFRSDARPKADPPAAAQSQSGSSLQSAMSASTSVPGPRYMPRKQVR